MRVSTALLGVLFVAAVFFALPGLAIVVNDALGWPRFAGRPGAGGCLIAAGLAVHGVTSRRFRKAGGTPVPTDAPSELVRGGPFAYSRNPIYLADLVILLGIFALRGHVALLAYTVLAGVALHLWLVSHEEPVLGERFGAAWDDYCARVPRWLGVTRASR